MNQTLPTGSGFSAGLRSIASFFLALLFLLPGCGETESPQVAIIRKQWQIQKDVTKLLQNIKDEASMKQSEAALLASFKSFYEVMQKTQNMLPPDPRSMEILRKEQDALDQTRIALGREMDRVGKLPGGSEFLGRVGKVPGSP